jgi:glycyl-tRNA synthetase beta chain
VGAVLGIADKVDSICGCFSVDLVPTGASDPYALRRQGIGIVQIMQNKAFSFSLRGLIRISLGLYGLEGGKKLEALIETVYTFIKNRISHLLAEEGFSKDVIAAVADVSVDDVPKVWSRVKALENLRGHKDFEPLVAGFKRVGNILKKAGLLEPGTQLQPVDATLFADKSEAALYDAFTNVAKKVEAAMQKAQFDQALKDIASLRRNVDAFFEGVMVMAEDQKLRANRLALLGHVAGLFGKFADFSKIAS